MVKVGNLSFFPPSPTAQYEATGRVLLTQPFWVALILQWDYYHQNKLRDYVFIAF